MKSFKARPKKQAPRMDIVQIQELHVGEEPVWDTERALKFTSDEFDKQLRASWKYYNYFFGPKDMKKYATHWIKANLKDLTKEQLSAWTAVDPNKVNMTITGMCRAVGKGMPLVGDYRNRVITHIMGLIQDQLEIQVKTKVKAKQQTVKAPSIQDRLAEKTAEVIGEIEGEVDNVFLNRPSDFNAFDFLTAKGFAQAQVGKIRENFQRQINELAELAEGKDKQLIEGYSYLKPADLKRINAFYEKLMADLDSYTHVKKATKRLAKAPRVISKEKLVAKVKYMKESKVLKLVSVNPADIIGATEVWVYNTKLRKLGKYVADAHAGTLGIKGTTILGFDEGKSTSKTLRKPEEQLKEFMKSGKIALRTFLSNIKAVETKLTGRLSEDVLILKVA